MKQESAISPELENNIMEFVVFAIESAAQKMNIPAPQLYNRLEKLDLIRYYLIEGYEMLHTQGRDYIADTLIEALQNWENYTEKEGKRV